MKIFRRLIFTFLFIAGIFSCFAFFFWHKPKFKLNKGNIYKSNLAVSSIELEHLKSKAEKLKEFAALYHYNTELCFLTDMNIPSGKNRFFVYDIKKDSVLLQGLVAHGSCDKGFQLTAIFSNKKDCGCSSLGKYKIGTSYNGRFGLAYRLYGLDSSNSNTFSRNIVLHSYDCVPDHETYPEPICNSRGCPMTSPSLMKKLKLIINNSRKPILLWIFE